MMCVSFASDNSLRAAVPFWRQSDAASGWRRSDTAIVSNVFPFSNLFVAEFTVRVSPRAVCGGIPPSSVWPIPLGSRLVPWQVRQALSHCEYRHQA